MRNIGLPVDYGMQNINHFCTRTLHHTIDITVDWIA